MELLLGVILGVIVTFLALYLTRKLRMAEEKQAQELHQNTLNERLLQSSRAGASPEGHCTPSQEPQSVRYIHSSDYRVPICISHRSRHRN